MSSSTRYAKPNTRDWKETQRLLRKDVIAAWQGRRLSEIGRADVHRMLDKMVDRGAAVTREPDVRPAAPNVQMGREPGNHRREAPAKEFRRRPSKSRATALLMGANWP